MTMSARISARRRCPTPCGVGGLKSWKVSRGDKVGQGPTPCGVGGLKYLIINKSVTRITSHPVRGGWIEIGLHLATPVATLCPTPCGVGGLKFGWSRFQLIRFKSHPVRGGWIEMILKRSSLNAFSSHPVRGGWIEITPLRECFLGSESHPVRGGWIEIASFVLKTRLTPSHPVRGGWIEIRCGIKTRKTAGCPTPCGVGGLKCVQNTAEHIVYDVPPRAGWVD